MILTLTQPNDLHAFAVEEGLRRKGAENELWFTSDLAQMQQATIAYRGNGFTWDVTGKGVHLGSENVDVVWYRRPEWPVVSGDLHPADRGFAEREYEEFLRWMVGFLPPAAFWVNPLAAGRCIRSKLEQQRIARRVGLQIPRTLYTNDPAQIRAFLRQEGGQIAFKPFLQQGAWTLGEWGTATLYTSLLEEDLLPEDDVLRATPGIYQQYLEKTYELRVTVVGRHVFPAKLDSQATREGNVDWRKGMNVENLRCEVTEIPAALERAILRFMDEAGLVFGCLDFVVTPQGEIHFLEVNEMGQWVFVEADTGLPILDAFCEMLLQRRPDFRWEASKAVLDYREMEGELIARIDGARREHIEPRPYFAGTEADFTATHVDQEGGQGPN